MTVDEMADDMVMDDIKRAWDVVTETEPALGKVSQVQLDAIAIVLDPLVDRADELDELDDEAAGDAYGSLAVLFARGAAIAIAAGDEAQAHRWFDAGIAYAGDGAYAAQLAAGIRDPERYRKLVHGRFLINHGREREARALWRELTKADATDALGHAAIAEQKAPRPLKDGQMPTLWSYNGFGLGFAGSRDRWEDGSYATTHCITALFIPLFPLRSYRVFQGDEDGSYFVVAREPLSAFARIARYVVAASIVLAIGGYFVNAHFNDPTRLAKQRWDDTLAAVTKAPPEDALRQLDARLADDIWRVGHDRAERAGAEVVRLTAGFAPKPFTAGSLDQATRLVGRYQALPEQARGGVARDALLATLDRWIGELGEAPATAAARLELLRHAAQHADARRAGALATRITAARLAVADATQAAAPLEALAMLVEEPSVDALARAHEIVERLAAQPSMLADAGADLDKWLAATPPADALRQRVEAQRDLAVAARAETQAEGLTRKQLEAMQKQRPWDQWAALALANHDANDGKLDAAAARLRALGEPALLVREARLVLGQLASALGQLEEADALLSGLLGSRLVRFQAASAALTEATTAAQKRLQERLQSGDVPYDLQTRLASASEEEGRELVMAWAREAMDADPAIKAQQETYMALSDIVPVSLTAGTVKLRRAQGMSGAARDAMLADAERTFLAIRTEAEGQPEFRLGLGEIFARLGKTKESEEEFAAVLAMKQPELSLGVARVYRDIGSNERAKQVATDVYNTATSPVKDNAAVLLGIMAKSYATEEESEAWFRKADPKDRYVQVSLLELEAQRLLRTGKLTECAAKFAAVAKAHLKDANAMDVAAYNNAALAHQNRFACSGDPSALADAEATLERAYRARSDQPIVVANLASVLASNAKRRVLGKRIDVRALRLGTGDADTLISMLLDGPERDAVLAELAADAGMRRAVQLFAQYEVLAPNSAAAYTFQRELAVDRRDEAALTALLARARSAKGLDVSETAHNRERLAKGELDGVLTEYLQATTTQMTDVLARPRLDAKTRAAANVILGRALTTAVYKRDAAALAQGREALVKAAELWPAMHTSSAIVGSLVDEAGLAADADAWVALRRERSAAAAVAKLVADGSPLAAKIRGSQPWAQIAAFARADTTRPGVDDLRLARLLGDAAIEARTKAVLDDVLRRRELELQRVLDPGNPGTAEDLAYLDKR